MISSFSRTPADKSTGSLRIVRAHRPPIVPRRYNNDTNSPTDRIVGATLAVEAAGAAAAAAAVVAAAVDSVDDKDTSDNIALMCLGGRMYGGGGLKTGR